MNVNTQLKTEEELDNEIKSLLATNPDIKIHIKGGSLEDLSVQDKIAFLEDLNWLVAMDNK